MSVTMDNASLYALGQKHLLSFGKNIVPDIITLEASADSKSDGSEHLGHTFSHSTGRKSQMSSLIGHGHPEVVATVANHIENLDHLFNNMVSPPVIHLAARLTAVLPEGLDKCIFLSTGGESNECAIKLAKMYTGKFEIVGLGASWHGMTSGAAGAQYHAGRKGYGPVMPGMHMLPSPDAYRSIFRNQDGSYDWKTELDYGWSLVDKASVDSLAAVIMEPLLSSGGMITLPSGYMKAMKEHCQKRGMLLIVDEAQTGIGRCGDLFAFQHEGVVPDILTLSKTLGNGIPLSAVVVSNEIAKVVSERGFLFSTTHVNDPLPAAVGLKVLEVVLRDNLVDRARAAGQRLSDGLYRLMAKYECIGVVRGRGLMMGVEIVKDRKTKIADIELGNRLSNIMMNLGLSAMMTSRSELSGCIRITPPLTITDEELAEGLAIFEEALRMTEGSKPLY
ncbi:hypothetical protein B7494_g7655 [Chlorociboria aeruginascens]|nr:hypothetical protein B7494_g7655 [Chlorociboria aeruginascens]